MQPPMLNSESGRQPWLIISGGFHSRGGMDKANLMFAEYLAECGRPVHVVCHFVEDRLAAHPMVKVHRVPRPLRSYFLGAVLLDWKARIVSKRLSRTSPDLRIVANGSNCALAGANWVHYVHSAWQPPVEGGSFLWRLRTLIQRSIDCALEKRAFRRARILIANSRVTERHILQVLSATPASPPDIRVIYLGSETSWGAITHEEKTTSRVALSIPPNRMVAVFVGGFGFDGRKGFDVLLGAWEILCRDPLWDVDLLVAGHGPALHFWETKVAQAGLSHRIRMLGFCNDVPGLLAAADLLVSVPRYEPYGLNIHEALARGLPVITSAQAGIAERLPEELKPLLIEEIEDPGNLVTCLRVWRIAPDFWRDRCTTAAKLLCARTWREMAQEMVETIESDAARKSPSECQAVSDAA